jgi:response regulator RpfG family c-di-GMP phosphodiesterase
MEYLRKETGVHFDPVCVKAWISVCERNPQVYKQFSNSKQELDLYRTYRPLREA